MWHDCSESHRADVTAATAEWGRLYMSCGPSQQLHVVSVLSLPHCLFPCYSLTGFHTLRRTGAGEDAPAHRSFRPTLKYIWHVDVCLGGISPVSPFHSFLCHSLRVIQPFLPQSLKLSCAGSAGVCGWKDASTSSLSSVLSFCFSPKTSSSLSQLHSVPFPQVKFPTPSPSLSLVYHSHPPPLLACCFPREVNLLSAGSMNSIGLELRPTRFPNIAQVFCIASAYHNPSSSIFSFHCCNT